MALTPLLYISKTRGTSSCGKLITKISSTTKSLRRWDPTCRQAPCNCTRLWTKWIISDNEKITPFRKGGETTCGTRKSWSLISYSSSIWGIARSNQSTKTSRTASKITMKIRCKIWPRISSTPIWWHIWNKGISTASHISGNTIWTSSLTIRLPAESQNRFCLHWILIGKWNMLKLMTLLPSGRNSLRRVSLRSYRCLSN